MGIQACDFFTLPRSLALFKDFFLPESAPWTWVSQIAEALASFNFEKAIHPTPIPPGLLIEGLVHLDPSAELPHYGVIQGPAFIGANCILRPGVFIRGNVIVGENCVLGNSCEYKNTLLMDHVQTAHFNYVGDSILGNYAHLGAGAILSNVRLDRHPVSIRTASGEHRSTNLKKLGACVGERVEIGCNVVLQPGTLVLPKSLIPPCSAIGGWVDPQSLKLSREQSERRRPTP